MQHYCLIACRRDYTPNCDLLHLIPVILPIQTGSAQPSQSTKRQAGEAGEDVRTFLVLALAEAVLGADRQVAVNVKQTCGDCEGTGARPGCRVEDCAVCRGMGQVLLSHTLHHGAMRLQ